VDFGYAKISDAIFGSIPTIKYYDTPDEIFQPFATYIKGMVLL